MGLSLLFSSLYVPILFSDVYSVLCLILIPVTLSSLPLMQQ